LEGGLTEFGIKRAEASGFYTRRRVNGVWVTGAFPKSEVDAELRGVRARTEAGPAAPPAPRGPSRPRTRQATRPAEPARPVQPVASKAALRAGSPMAELPAGPPAADATASTSAAPATAEDHRLRLQQALERRAREMAEPGPKPPEPRSVSFDFETGLKTIVFEGDRVVREPFDPDRVRALASPGGAPRP
jgi:hypothetical protein